MDEPQKITAAEKVLKKIHFTRKFCVFMVLAVIGLMLSGYITVSVLKLTNDGINGEIGQLQKENEKLKASNVEYSHNNDQLTMEISQLAKTNSKLTKNVVAFQVQNAIFANSIMNLNKTSSRLASELVNLKTNQIVLEGEVENFQNRTQVLAGQVDHLDDLDETLQEQLQNFTDLRKEISQYSKQREESLQDVMQTAMMLFQNISRTNTLNQKIQLFNIAVGAEYLQDRKPGFTEFEYKRFLNNSGGILKKTETELNSLYPYDQQPKDSDGIISWDTVVVIISNMIIDENNAQQVRLTTDLQDYGMDEHSISLLVTM